MGAEVIKVERPVVGDDTRHWGPPWIKDAQGRETTESAYYLSTNRGKRSVAIDLATAEGQALVRRLAAGADVFVENFKVGALARFGLDYRTLRPDNPRLIYLSISAFGQDGPRAAGPGYDAMIQAMGGLMSITGVPDGEPGAGPQKVGVAVADLMCGMYAMAGDTRRAARAARVGSRAVHRSVAARHAGRVAREPEPELPRDRARPPRAARHGAPEHRAVSGLRNGRRSPDARGRQRCAVRAVLRRDGTRRRWRDDPRYASNRTTRGEPRAARCRGRRGARARDPRAALARGSCATRDVPCGPINDLAQVFAEPQVRHRGMRIDLPHRASRQRAWRAAIRYSTRARR